MPGEMDGSNAVPFSFKLEWSFKARQNVSCQGGVRIQSQEANAIKAQAQRQFEPGEEVSLRPVFAWCTFRRRLRPREEERSEAEILCKSAQEDAAEAQAEEEHTDG